MATQETLQWLPERVKDYTFIVEVGNEYFEHGRTRLVVKGSGEAQIENAQDGRKTSYTAHLPASEAESLFRELGSARFWRTELGKRPGVPDEARFELEMQLGEQRVGRVSAWDGETEEDAALREVLGRLRAFVNEASKGAVLL